MKLLFYDEDKELIVVVTALDLDSVITVQPGFDFNIAKAIRASNGEVWML